METTNQATPETPTSAPPSMDYATYCPEDNKLRLYVGRVPRADYERLRAEGWTSTPKQGCDFVATWTPGRADTAAEYGGGVIEDEDQAPTDRAADRAERFGGYLDKRTTEAGELADKYEAGPEVYANQDKARAVRMADRADRCAVKALDSWRRAEYWQRRTAGVISHALYKSEPGVRMGRIKRLEAEQRGHEEGREQHRRTFEAWETLADMPGADELLPLGADGYADPEKMNRAQQVAYMIASTGKSNISLMHPDGGEIDANGKRVQGTGFYGFSAYDFLTHDSYGGGPFRRLTPKEYAAHYLKHAKSPEDYGQRWSEHYALRLGYENQMLEAEGGRAGQLDMVPGGFVGNRQIQKVNKSPATGRVVSVAVWRTTTGYTRESDYKVSETRPCLVTITVERMATGVYRAPTAEELTAFEADQKAAKAERKATEPKAPQLLNLTDADAERLQAVWNDARRVEYEKRHGQYARAFRPATVYRMTQATYSANSKGSYSICEPRDVCRGGMLGVPESNMWSAERDKERTALGPVLCKVRTTRAADPGQESPDVARVIILTDKPQKAMPPEVWTTAPAKVESAPAVPVKAVQQDLFAGVTA